MKLKTKRILFFIVIMLFAFGFCAKAGSCTDRGCEGLGDGGGWIQPQDKISIGNIDFSVGSHQDRTLCFYGSVYGPYEYQNDDTETLFNYKGFWSNPSYMANWSTPGPIYDDSGQFTCTKIYFTLESPESDKYYYSQTGVWTGENNYYEAYATARQATRGKIPLRYITDSSGSITKLQYEYDTTNGLITTTSRNSSGSDAKYVIYDLDTNGNIERIWAGTDTDDFKDRSDQDPLDGRWMDLDVDSTTGMITKTANSCGSCGGSSRGYTFGSGVNSDSITSVSDADGDVLVSYRYDSQNRKTSHWLGDHSTGNKVTEWVYIDYDPANPESSGTSKLIKKSYVDNTNYRTVVHISDDQGTILETREYHDLQSGNTFLGDFSRTLYEYERQGGNAATRKITILPRGNKIYDYYDNFSSGHNVTKHTREDFSSNEITIKQKSYTNVGSGQYGNRYVVQQSINASGGTMDYSYSGQNLIRKIEPEASIGSGRLTTDYKYDSENRLTLQIKGDLSTKYDYDDYGNMITRIEDYTGSNAATTLYHYNEFNEQTRVIDSRGNIQDKFYSSGGVVTAEWIYEDSTCAKLLKATEYEYDDNGRLTKLKVADERSSWSTSATPSWAETLYFYDSYGRRTSIVVDPGGKNLTTSYQYDNQSAITKVTKPDGSSTITVRDGRGLLKKEINKFETVSSTTNYYYDDNGNLIKKEDPEGVCEVYQYDGFDRRTHSRKGK